MRLSKSVPTRTDNRLLLLVNYAAAAGISRVFQLPCVARLILHVPCPGCGYTRALLAALRLDFAAAWHYHPLFILFPVLVLLFFRNGVVFKQEKLNVLSVELIGSLFLITWLIRLCAGTLPE